MMLYLRFLKFLGYFMSASPLFYHILVYENDEFMLKGVVDMLYVDSTSKDKRKALTQIGNGRKAIFWKDITIGHSPLKD